jgi:hypothetical protein
VSGAENRKLAVRLSGNRGGEAPASIIYALEKADAPFILVSQYGDYVLIVKKGENLKLIIPKPTPWVLYSRGCR